MGSCLSVARGRARHRRARLRVSGWFLHLYSLPFFSWQAVGSLMIVVDLILGLFCSAVCDCLWQVVLFPSSLGWHVSLSAFCYCSFCPLYSGFCTLPSVLLIPSLISTCLLPLIQSVDYVCHGL